MIDYNSTNTNQNKTLQYNTVQINKHIIIFHFEHPHPTVNGFGGHITDWRYGRGVPGHVTKHKCSIQVIRRAMGSHHRLAMRTWGPCTVHTTKHVFDSGHSTIHGVTPVTGRYGRRVPVHVQNTSVRFRSVDDA